MYRLSQFYTRHRGKLWLSQAVVLLGLGLLLGLILRGGSTTDDAAGPDGHSGNGHAGNGHAGLAANAVQEPQLWTCSMHPQIRRDQAGKCPICGMDLVRVKQSVGGIRTLSISPAVKKLMQLETVPVVRRYVTADVRMVGKVDYDETRLAHVTARVAGRLDRLYVDYTGIAVSQGDHMAYLYSEELYAVQEELLQAIKYARQAPANPIRQGIGTLDLAESARVKLRLLGITDQQIKEIEQQGQPTDHLTIYSPATGIVIEKLKQEGDRVRMGDRLYTVADLKQLWVQLDAYESDLVWLRYGQAVEFSTEAYPGEVFQGRVSFINPVLNPTTRTVKVRVNVSNEQGRLKPDMFVRAVVRSQIAAGGRVLDASLAGKWISPMHPEIVKDEPGNCDVCGMPLVRAETLGYVTAEPSDTAKPLVIPVSAALLTGTRAIVYVQDPGAAEPTYDGREIVLGPRAGDYYLVKTGLAEGELVVTHGNFKLDSALQISAKPSMMTPEGGGATGGHDHGSSSKSNDEGELLGEAGETSMSLSPQLKQQLQQTIQAVDAIGAAIAAADLAKIREAYRQLGQQVAAINAAQLAGEMQSQLQEFAMLLRNDAVEGSEITALENADRIYRVTKRHAVRFEAMFGLSHAEHQAVVASLEVPAEFRVELSRIVPVYLSLGQSLAADEASSAAEPIARLQQGLDSINSHALSGSAADRWNTELASLTTIVARLAAATELASLRSEFALLSEELLTLQRTFGFANSDQLFELHCPMAFDGRGASWIQSDDTVRNPYYGAAMLRCADRVEVLSVREGEASDGHAGHDHG